MSKQHTHTPESSSYDYDDLQPNRVALSCADSTSETAQLVEAGDLIIVAFMKRELNSEQNPLRFRILKIYNIH